MSILSQRRTLTVATGIALIASAVAIPAGRAAAHAPASSPPSASITSAAAHPHDDFNGDGYPDVAVGAPAATVGDAADAGAVSVLYGGPGGLSAARAQVLTWPDRPGLTSPQDARYGTDLHSDDLDLDGYADLVGRLWSGTADGDIGTTIAVNWGGPSGLSPDATVLKPIPGDQEEGPGNLAVGDVDGDGIADIAVGDVRHGGHVLHGPVTRSGGWSRVSGFTLAGTDAIDTSGLAIGDVTGDGTGDLAVIGFGPDDPWLQHTFLLAGGRSGLGAPVEIRDADGAGVGGTSVGIADLDRDGRGDLVIGRGDEWPHVDTPAKRGGALFVSYGGARGQSTDREPVWINQDTAGVPGKAELYDRMGDNVSFGDTDGDGYPDVVTGLPGEDVNGTADAGRVLVLKGGPRGVSGAGARGFHQDTAGVPGRAEEGDQFGEGATSLGDHDADGRAGLVVGDPSENGSRGALWIFRSNATGVVAKGSLSFGAARIGAPAGRSRFGQSLTS